MTIDDVPAAIRRRDADTIVALRFWTSAEMRRAYVHLLCDEYKRLHGNGPSLGRLQRELGDFALCLHRRTLITYLVEWRKAQCEVQKFT